MSKNIQNISQQFNKEWWNTTLELDEIKLMSDKNKIPVSIINRDNAISVSVDSLNQNLHSYRYDYDPKYYIIGFLNNTLASETIFYKKLKAKYPFIFAKYNQIFIPKNLVTFKDKEIKELKIIRPPKTWNLDKPDIDIDLIKPGDIFQFSVVHGEKRDVVKQKFIRYNQVEPDMLITRDLDKVDLPEDRGGWDYWMKNNIKNYYKNISKQYNLREIKIDNDDYKLFLDLLKQNKDKITGGYGTMIKVGIDNPEYHKELIDTLLLQMRDSYKDSERVFGKELTDLAKKINTELGFEDDELSSFKKQHGLDELKLISKITPEMVIELHQSIVLSNGYSTNIETQIDIFFYKNFGFPSVLEFQDLWKRIKTLNNNQLKEIYQFLLNIKKIHNLREIKLLGGNTVALMIKYNNLIDKLDEIGKIYGDNSYYVRRTVSEYPEYPSFPKFDLIKDKKWVTPKIVEKYLKKIKQNIKNTIKEYYHDKRMYNKPTDFGFLKIKEIYEKDLGGEEIFYEELNEQIIKKPKIKEFLQFCIKELGLKTPLNCKIKLTKDKSKTKTYAHYDPNQNEIVVYTKNRSLGDIERSIAHELVHHQQNLNNQLLPGSGETGSPQENEANEKAGVLLRKWGELHPEIFTEIKLIRKPVPFNSKEFAELRIEIKETFSNRLIDIKDWGHKETANSGLFNYGSYYHDYVSFSFYLKDLNKEDEEIINNIINRYKHKWGFTDDRYNNGERDKYRYQYDRVPNVWITLFKERITTNDRPIGESFSKEWWSDVLELNEIGELSSTFEFVHKGKDPEENVLYSFKTPQNEYTVAFIDLENGAYERYFNTKEGSYNSNEGIALKVISTVTKITMDFISKYEPNEISIHPIATGKDEFNNNIRRKNISLALLNKNIDKSKYDIISTPRHILIKKKDINEIKLISKEGKIYNLDTTELNGDQIIDLLKPGDYIQAGQKLWRINNIGGKFIDYEGVNFKSILTQLSLVVFRDEIDIYKEKKFDPKYLFEMRLVSSQYKLKFPPGYNLNDEIKEEDFSNFVLNIINLNPIIKKYYEDLIKVKPTINIINDVKEASFHNVSYIVSKILFEIFYRLFTGIFVTVNIEKELIKHNYIIDENFIKIITNNKFPHYSYGKYLEKNKNL